MSMLLEQIFLAKESIVIEMQKKKDSQEVHCLRS